VNELQTAGSIEKVLWVIRDHFSFFNFHIIEHIVSKLGTDQDKAELHNYTRKNLTVTRSVEFMNVSQSLDLWVKLIMLIYFWR